MYLTDVTRRILIIEDDLDVSNLLKHFLGKENYEVSTAATGRSGLSLALKQKPNLVILDLMLPELDGLEVCKELRRNPQTSGLPILMLTAKGEEADKVIGLELGADDYIVKPFSPKELLARIRALLRRLEISSQLPKTFRFQGLSLDVEKHEIYVNGRLIELTAKEFGLLQALLQNIGRVLTREALLNSVWGEDYAGGSRTVDVHIRKLREKIPLLEKELVTIKGLGYKLKGK